MNTDFGRVKCFNNCQNTCQDIISWFSSSAIFRSELYLSNTISKKTKQKHNLTLERLCGNEQISALNLNFASE